MARTASIISRDDPYLYVRVLLVSWEGADRRLDDELQGLEQTFKDVYEFTTARYKIQSNNPFGSLTTALLEFLEHDDPDTLLILYYGGHGYSNSDNQLIWSLYSGGNPCVNWTALQQHVFDKKSDFLILLDCCTAASAVGERQRGNVEALFSCGIQDKTPISGDYCFTRRLSNMMRQHPDGIEVYELFHRLTQEYNKAGPDRRDKGKEPAYLKPGKDLRRSIQLRRMNSFYSAKSVIALGRRSLRSLRSTRPAQAMRALETVLVVQTSTGNRGDDSSVATRSTMYYSIANGDEAAGPEGSEVMEEESTQFSELLSALADENRRVLNAAMDRIETNQDVGDASMGDPESPSFSPFDGMIRINRLTNEIRFLQKAMANGPVSTWFTISPISDANILEWQATLRGPDGTPYERGLFHVRLSLTNIHYPFYPPRVWFHTKIYHPNIDQKTGAICADYLQGPPPKVVDTSAVEATDLAVEPRRRDEMEQSDGEAPQNLSHNQNTISLQGPEDATSQSPLAKDFGEVGIRAFMPPPNKKREERNDIDTYSAAFGLEGLVVGLYVILNEPNLTDALEPEIARQMIEDPAGYERTAREWTKLYATGAV